MRKILFVTLASLLMVLSFAAFTPSTVQAQACPGAMPPRLVVGETGQVAHVYSTLWTGIGSLQAFDVMFRVNGDTFEVISGPYCVGPHYWWEVEHNGVRGFSTEGSAGVYWLEPATDDGDPADPPPPTDPPRPPEGQACPGAPSPRLTAGDTGGVAQVYSSLRANFDSNNIITIMYRALDDTFTVIDGPFCGFGPYNWYNIEHNGVEGWATEGTGSAYWLEPLAGS